jgi:hypothetical protein
MTFTLALLLQIKYRLPWKVPQRRHICNVIGLHRRDSGQVIGNPLPVAYPRGRRDNSDVCFKLRNQKGNDKERFSWDQDI